MAVGNTNSVNVNGINADIVYCTKKVKKLNG